MLYKVWPSFTGTEAAWNQIQRTFVYDFDVEKCPYLGNKAIVNMGGFRNKPSKKWSQARILPKLESLKKWLEKKFTNSVDPIQYILYLYYKEELIVDEILERCQKLWLTYKTQGWFHKFLTNSLWWELRDNKEITERRRKKISRKSSPSLQWLKRSREALWEENSKKFNHSLLNILETNHTVKIWFSLGQFNWFDTKSEKIFYLLELYEWISFKILCDIARDTNMWWGSIARIINNKLNLIHRNYSEIPLLTISPWMIHNLLKKVWVKQ